MKTNNPYALMLSILGVVSVLILVGAWVINFHQYKISPNPKDWSDFGCYMGGAVSSIISMLALFGVAVGISEQNKSNRHLTSQSLLEAIRNFEKDIDSSLKEVHRNLSIGGKCIEINIYQLLMTARLTHILPEVLPKCRESESRIEKEEISLLDEMLALEELLTTTWQYTIEINIRQFSTN